jgi:hypothetical protein
LPCIVSPRRNQLKYETPLSTNATAKIRRL